MAEIEINIGVILQSRLAMCPEGEFRLFIYTVFIKQSLFQKKITSGTVCPVAFDLQLIKTSEPLKT